MKKYFPKLMGNEKTVERIGTAIESATLPHAFLIGGPSGSGKTTLAIEIAAALNCERLNDSASALPCGVCNCCRRIYDGNFPDLKILSKNKDMFLSSTESDRKIYIIDDAESMTTEAQNALLKVLEEPPKSVVIILLAKECDRILTTIKSRAQYIAMSRFDEKELAEILLKSNLEARTLKASSEEKFNNLIMSADGRLGLAKSLLGKKLFDENEEERSDVIKLISAISQKPSYTEIHATISGFPTKRVDLTITLERLVSALRDLLAVKYDENVKTVFFSSAKEAENYAKGISQKRILAVYDAVNEINDLCSKNAIVANLLSTLSSRIITAINN